MSGPERRMVPAGPVDDSLAESLAGIVGPRWVCGDADITDRRTVDWTGRRGPHDSLVVQPADAAETAAVLALCARHGTPVVPQGGNTGLVEGSVPPENGWVVVATDRLVELGELDHTSGQVTVGAGVTLAALQRHLAGTGWRFAVDLAARDSATVGGMVATNAGGTRVFRHGSTRAQLLGIEIACVNGSVVDTTRKVDKDNTRYDLAALVCGSEGTLGVVTAARLRLLAERPEKATALLGFGDPASAIDASWALRRLVPDAEVIELIGPGCIELVRDAFGIESPWSSPVDCALLVEAAGADGEAVLARLSTGIATVAPIHEAVGVDEPARSRLWRHRDLITDALARPGLNPLKLDVSVPASSTAKFCDWVFATVESVPSARLYLFGHVCDHNLHLNVTGLAADRRDSLERSVLEHVVSIGGSISAEHGIGRRRVGLIERFRDPAELDLARAIKAAWDPTGIMNPGVMFNR